jgi:hypothetical protein
VKLGLYLLIQPHGSKLWRLAFRFGGKQKMAFDGIRTPSPHFETPWEFEPLKAGHNVAGLVTQVTEQVSELICLLKEIQKTLPTGDANIATYNALIASLS